ncbi:glutamate--cysteine ligase [Kitasatospora sp. MBT63]|uniref:carboxylate-amine ligase n=1 Tax=Kitasatospora sp. MBT63 TaxID=1444768 RepID=UPI00053B4047|nr:glutamate--cysteine ligase [Kitasatospora sp. MBT63]
MDTLTVGVEEEFFLVHPATGRTVPRAEQVRTAAGLRPALASAEVQSGLLQCQLEVNTPVCRTLDEVGGHLLRLRHSLAEAADELDCRLAASGSAPFAPLGVPAVSASPRYRSMKADAAQLAAEQLICGMHVHVGVPDRATGVAVLNRLRPWIPVLVALGGNSPMWDGTDTDFASWRTVVFGRWPVSGTPPPFEDADDYERRVGALVDHGIIRDRGQLYWHARLSERFPTVEVRATDVQLRPEEAVMLAGLIRALVATAMAGERAGAPAPVPPTEFMAGAVWHAARYGLTNELHDPLTGRQAKAGDVVAALLKYTLAALREAGDERQVTSLAHRLLREGQGADRQRAALAAAGATGLVRLITGAVPAS